MGQALNERLLSLNLFHALSSIPPSLSLSPFRSLPLDTQLTSVPFVFPTQRHSQLRWCHGRLFPGNKPLCSETTTKKSLCSSYSKHIGKTSATSTSFSAWVCDCPLFTNQPFISSSFPKQSFTDPIYCPSSLVFQINGKSYFSCFHSNSVTAERFWVQI